MSTVVALDGEIAEVLDLSADIAKPFEGLRLEPYHDPVGYPTVGYGHLLSRKPWADLAQWSAITEDQAEDLLERDMVKAYRSVARLITVPLMAPQTAALVDFAFNCGSGNLQASTLRRVINRGELDAAPEQFMRWVFARSVRLPGLVRRRRAEVDMWLSAA
jgi:lysozyme